MAREEDSDQRQLNQLAFEAQSFQQQGQTMQQQLSSLQSSVVEMRATMETLKNLQHVKAKNALLPIGSGILLNANVEKTEKVLVEVGSGIVVEKPIPEAIQLLESRNKKIEETRDKLQDALGQVSEKLRKIDSEAKVIMAKMNRK